MYKNKCEFCGREFNSKYVRMQYCSIICKMMAEKSELYWHEQPCWSCRNAISGCSWSEELTPVKGWIAKPLMVKDGEGNIRTYKIIYCPLYKHE